MSAPVPGPPVPRPGPPGAGLPAAPAPAPALATTPPATASDAPADALVEDVRDRLAALRERPVDEHVAAYDDVHRRLQDALASLDGA